MCIIVVKPKNQDFPTWRTMENCFTRNPDGAGFMWNGTDGKVHIQKGFMDFSSFKKALKLAKRQMNNETAVVMHFRIKTHGEVSKECCHPFPLAGNLDQLRKIECVSKYGIAHNGIFCNRNSTTKKSDTMDYILNILYPIYKMSDDVMHDKYARRLISETSEGCRLAILNGNGVVDLIGSWEYDDGIAYSNKTYKAVSYMLPQGSAIHSNWKLDTSSGAYFYNATAAEEYGYGYDDYKDYDYLDGWEDEDEKDAKEFLNTMIDGWACPMCLDRDSCVANRNWFCDSEDESKLVADWYMGGYED